MDTRIVVGGYTNGDSDRVGVASYLWRAGDPTAADLVVHPQVPMTSPAWVEPHPDRNIVYAVSEAVPPAGATMQSLAVSATGELSAHNAVPITGRSACHLALTPDARFLVIANYGEGSVSAFPILPDGSVGDQADHHQFSTSGPDPQRQQAAHAHQVVMDGDGFWVADLGGDVIHRLGLDTDGRFTRPAPPVTLPPGTGPRHLVLSGEHMLVACELSAQLWVGRRNGDTVEQEALVASTQRESAERVYPSGIGLHTSDRGIQVLIANRGCDTVAVFDFDPEGDERVRLRQEFDTGSWPRDLKVYRDRLWVAAQHGNRVLTYLPDTGSGDWRADFEFAASSPSCVLQLP